MGTEKDKRTLSEMQSDCLETEVNLLKIIVDKLIQHEKKIQELESRLEKLERK
jgi:hypothetical protein